MSDSVTIPNENPGVQEKPARQPFSFLAIVSFASGALLLAVHMIVRLLMAVPALTYESAGGLTFVFGLLGLFSIIPIVVGIALGHAGLAATSKTKSRRGRGLAVSGLTANYILFLLYLNRLIVALIVVTTGAGQNFVDVFAYYI
jgi:hypothetical protein